LTGHSHDYKRNGTSTLFAAFEVATGEVTAAHKRRRRRVVDETGLRDSEDHFPFGKRQPDRPIGESANRSTGRPWPETTSSSRTLHPPQSTRSERATSGQSSRAECSSSPT